LVIKKDIVEKLLEHKDPFLFVDEIKEINENNITTTFKLNRDLCILKGHFPDFPVLPGVIMIEIINQSALLKMLLDIYESENIDFEKKIKYKAFVSKIEYFNFKGVIIPDTNIEIKIEIRKTLIDSFFEVKGKIFEKSMLKCFGCVILYFERQG
jgi:3-hydroxyacyl-[acyl-carrier-protein] dehydratase